MRREDEIRMRHMLDAAREALGFVAGRERSALDDNRKLTLALVKSVEIIGEAARNVSDATRAGLPEIPWLDITGMRHRLVHAYFDIRLDVVWNTVTQNLPPLIAELERILEAPSGPPAP
ncbi:MAG: DUF86 domain-containing protein [Candidatus Lambdaproteobacteria bacterium]|nr:DUF86 domain-containing protein [Candidatus Lambdaproteobacteria bacterium]